MKFSFSKDIDAGPGCTSKSSMSNLSFGHLFDILYLRLCLCRKGLKMHEHEITRIARFLEETANKVNDLDYPKLQMTLSELQDVMDHLVGDTLEFDPEREELTERLQSLATRCMDLCLERLLVHN